MFGTITDKKLAIFGFAFKANTNDTRESPSKYICQKLLEEGAILAIYDPKVVSNQIFKDLYDNDYLEDISQQNTNNVMICTSQNDAAKGADAIIVMTEWEEFKNIDWDEICKLMRAPSWLFDTRSICDINKAKVAGINYWSVGNGK